MTHVMKMFDPSKYVSAVDLNGKDVTLTIAKVVAGEVVGEMNRKAKKPMMYFKGAGKPLALNKTNAKTLIKMYGPDVEKWVDRRVTLYPATTQMKKDGVLETVECVRIRPKRPEAGKPTEAPATFTAAETPPEREPGDDTDEEATNANA